MKSLVTGGAGFIGSHLVDKLIGLGHEVIVIDSAANTNRTYFWNTLAQNYKYDICDYKLIEPLFNNVDYVFHLAAESKIDQSIINPLQTIQTNIIGTVNVLECAKNNNVKRVIYSSTSAVYGNNIPNIETQATDPLNPYSVSKLYGEHLCSMYYKLFGLETIMLRYFNVYGPGQADSNVIGMFQYQKQNNLPLTIVGNGEQRRDFVYIEDVVNANMLASNAKLSANLIGTAFNIGTGRSYSVNDIVKFMDHEYVYMPLKIGEAEETLANNQKAMTYLSWYPSVRLEKYLQDIHHF
jgi:UDP-glucose 4-epimerase